MSNVKKLLRKLVDNLILKGEVKSEKAAENAKKK